MTNGMSAKQLVITVVLVELASAVMVFAILASQGQTWLGVAFGAGILIFPVVLIPLVINGIASLTGWRTLARNYPEAESAPPESERKTLSMGIRWPLMSVNNAILGAADERHLHLMFVPLFSFGIGPVSIPWAAVTEIEPSTFGRIKLTILGGPSLWVPREMVRDELEVRAAMGEVT